MNVSHMPRVHQLDRNCLELLQTAVYFILMDTVWSKSPCSQNGNGLKKMIRGWLTIREAFHNWAIDAASYPGIIYRFVSTHGGSIPGWGSNQTKLY